LVVVVIVVLLGFGVEVKIGSGVARRFEVEIRGLRAPTRGRRVETHVKSSKHR
jgi:hypothetical protein